MAKTELFGRWLQGSVVVEDQGKSTGERFFVHAGTGSDTAGYGRTPTTPFASLAYAVTRCTAGRHDIIKCMEGHAETITVTITPLASTRIVGLGSGGNRPTFTPDLDTEPALHLDNPSVVMENVCFNEAAGLAGAPLAAIQMSAPHCAVRGLHFDMGAADLTGILVNDLGSYSTIEDCRVRVLAAGPLAWVEFDDPVFMPVIRHNKIVASDGADAFAVSVIDFDGEAVEVPLVYDNEINGAGVAVASIADVGAVVGAHFAGNRVSGGATSQDNLATITAASFADNAITADKIAADALANAKFADNAISAAKIANNAITADKVATDALTRAKFDLSAGEITTDGVVVSRATEALPQTAAGALFVVAGHVMLRRILGEVTTAVGNVPNATKLQLNSDGVGATTDLCNTLDIDDDVVGTTYEITGTAANAMVDSINLPKNPAQLLDVLLVPGVVEIDCAGSDGGDGRVRWSMVYVPLEEGAHVVTA